MYLMLSILVMPSCLCSLSRSITCYVFCEKRTEVVDNTYVTTRGCSVDYRWEDVRGYQDNRRACWSFASWTAPSVEG